MPQPPRKSILIALKEGLGTIVYVNVYTHMCINMCVYIYIYFHQVIIFGQVTWLMGLNLGPPGSGSLQNPNHWTTRNFPTK